MVIFSSRLPIYMRLAFIPGIIISIIRSTLHSIANILRNFGDRCQESKILWPIAGVIKWALGPLECRQARRLRLRKPTSYLRRQRQSILLNKVLFICFVVFPVMDKTFVKALQLHTTVQWIPWTPMPPRRRRFRPDSRELLRIDREMDWDRMCQDPSIWLTDEERNPAKRYVTGTTRNRREANKLEHARKATMHRYKRNEHLIFRYHSKASARRTRLKQKQRELAEQISKAQAKLKQHHSPKEREKQEWNEWFYSVKWEDGKQADPNQEPDAHIIEKPPSSASLFQRFMEEKYNKFFFDLIRGIHP
jgi:hypothetical protein